MGNPRSMLRARQTAFRCSGMRALQMRGTGSKLLRAGSIVLRTIRIEALATYEQTHDLDARVPAELRKLSAAPFPWTSYVAIASSGEIVGACAFKNSPDAHGRVEIAYLTLPGFEGQGVATQMAAFLTEIAHTSGFVRQIDAHTLATESASVRICKKLGFDFAGEINDPDDGPVWLWVKSIHSLEKRQENDN